VDEQSLSHFNVSLLIFDSRRFPHEPPDLKRDPRWIVLCPRVPLVFYEPYSERSVTRPANVHDTTAINWVVRIHLIKAEVGMRVCQVRRLGSRQRSAPLDMDNQLFHARTLNRSSSPWMMRVVHRVRNEDQTQPLIKLLTSS
jgi:hypothetical protein